MNWKLRFLMEPSCWGILQWKINVWTLRYINHLQGWSGLNCSETRGFKMNINEWTATILIWSFDVSQPQSIYIFHQGNWQILLMMINTTIMEIIMVGVICDNVISTPNRISQAVWYQFCMVWLLCKVSYYKLSSQNQRVAMKKWYPIYLRARWHLY